MPDGTGKGDGDAGEVEAIGITDGAVIGAIGTTDGAVIDGIDGDDARLYGWSGSTGNEMKNIFLIARKCNNLIQPQDPKIEGDVGHCDP